MLLREEPHSHVTEEAIGQGSTLAFFIFLYLAIFTREISQKYWGRGDRLNSSKTVNGGKEKVLE